MTDTAEPASAPQAAAAELREAPRTTVPAALSDRLPRAWMFPLLAFAATSVLIVAAWNVTNAVHGYRPWENYFFYKDSGWYALIARFGYPPASLTAPTTHSAKETAFFPLFPATIRLAMYVTGNVVTAGLTVQILAGAASAVAVWALASHIYGHRIADRAVLLYCAFPGAFVLGVMYSESLAVLLAAACLLMLLQRRWVLAGLLALLAGAEHSTLIVLTPVLAAAAAHAIWTRREWRSLIAPVLAPLGLLAYFTYLWYRYHDFFFWFRVEKFGWKIYTDFGAHTLSVLTWTYPLAHKLPWLFGMVVATFWIALISIGLLVATRAPWPVTLYSALLLLSLSISTQEVMPRYTLPIVGMFLGYAAKLPKWAFWVTLVVSASVMVFLVGYYPTHRHIPHFNP